MTSISSILGKAFGRQERQAVGALWLCETSGAGPLAPRHLRRLTGTGPRTGGGADSPALCGREVAWDVSVARADDLVAEAASRRVPVCAGCLRRVPGVATAPDGPVAP